MAVSHPLPEVVLLVVDGTIAACDPKYPDGDRR
jgi:hypothetical protein